MTENRSISTKALRILEVLFIFSLIMAGWGPVTIPAGPEGSITIPFCTWFLFVPLYTFSIICRLLVKDLKPGLCWKDPFLLFGLLAFLSGFWNPLRDFSLAVNLYMPALLGYFLFRYLLSRDFNRCSAYFWPPFLAALSLTIARGIMENPAVLKGHSMLGSSLAHHNHMAMNLLLGIPAAIVLMHREKKSRLIYGAVVLFMLFGLALTNSRSGWIGAMVACTCFTWNAPNPRLKKLALAAVLAGSLCIGLYASTRERFATLANPVNDSSFRCRIDMWRVSAHLIKMHPLGGIGFSNRIFMALEHTTALELCKKGIIREPALYDPHPHNLFLQVAVYLGIGGFCLLIWMIHLIWRSFSTLATSCGKETMMLTALHASLWGFLAVNLADTVFNNPQSTLFILLFLAYILEWAEAEKKTVHRPGVASDRKIAIID